MIKALIGRKLGMTQVFEAGGIATGVTVIEAGPCIVTQVKSVENDGYRGVQLGWETVEEDRLTQPERGHLRKKKLPLVRHLREVPVDEAGDDPKLGDRIDVTMFAAGETIDIIGTSKGKGFAGVMKRHNFRGGKRTHGQSDRQRHPGSIGPGSTPGRVFLGTRMAGRMGNDRVTVQNLRIVSIDAERNLIMVKGAVPGPTNGMVFVRKAVKAKKK
ncbi:MAG: 50S ribosomal protein L3 [Chloroflexota bacterium]|nr:50S ribosomal protein L3 [Chloroflexota bacterium]MDQ5867991.1 50S ribosomal protein L3 [Chloroflexota bacterium]